MLPQTDLECSTTTNERNSTPQTCITPLDRLNQDVYQESDSKLTKPLKTSSNLILQGPKMKPWLLIPIVEY